MSKMGLYELYGLNRYSRDNKPFLLTLVETVKYLEELTDFNQIQKPPALSQRDSLPVWDYVNRLQDGRGEIGISPLSRLYAAFLGVQVNGIRERLPKDSEAFEVIDQMRDNVGVSMGLPALFPVGSQQQADAVSIELPEARADQGSFLKKAKEAIQSLQNQNPATLALADEAVVESDRMRVQLPKPPSFQDLKNYAERRGQERGR